jgi:NADH dehydrogenase [ubiquinone] 1 alpha subcomplex assembly factor 7
MADILRAARIRAAFIAGAQITLVETSPVLRAAQGETLADRSVTWRESLSEVPKDLPLFLVANEFFDALPIHQFIRKQARWHERMIRADGDALVFVAAPETVPDSAVPAQFREGPDGAMFETSPASQAIAQDIAHRIAQTGGVALIIDYGHAPSALGDTFQAVKAHRYADPLAEPGEADLTAHVDFGALAAAAREQHAQVSGPVTQAAFLAALGIHLRAERLKHASPEKASEVDAALDRLTKPAQMGTLFKVMAITAPSAAPPLAFPL